MKSAFVLFLIFFSLFLAGCLSGGQTVPAPKIVFQCAQESFFSQMKVNATIANTGNAAGAACVNVLLKDRNNTENSEIVCSGELQPSNSVTKQVRFGLAVLGGKQYSVECKLA